LWLQSTTFGQTNFTSDKNTITTGVAFQSFNIQAEYGMEYRVRVRVSDVAIPPPEFNDMFLSPTIAFAPISVNVSLPTGTPIVDQPLTATATVTGYDSRIPIKYKWTWHENPSGTNTPIMTETTTSSTSSITPTTTANYRVEVELLYALDSVTTGVSASEISSNAFQPFEWVQGPQIQFDANTETYFVLPTAPANFVGNFPITFSYEWMKDNNAFGTNSSSQTLTDPGTYTVDVTGSNTANSQTYVDTILSSNSIVITPNLDPEISYLEMWTEENDSAPAGTQITPTSGQIRVPIGAEYYVFAYNNNDDLITEDVLYGDSRNPVTTTISAQASTNAAAVGDTLTVDNIVVTGDPVRGLVTYEWFRGGALQHDDATYEVEEADEGFAITCVASVTSGGSSAATVPPLSFGTVPSSAVPPDVSITVLTPASPTEGDTLTITASATGDTPITLEYQFEDAALGGPILQAFGSSNTYLTDVNDVGITVRARVRGTNAAGTDTETSTWTNAIAASSGETILDTFTNTGQVWRSGNRWWNVLQTGTWSSTGTNVGTWLEVDASSYIRDANVRFGPATSTPVPTGAKIRVTFTPDAGSDTPPDPPPERGITLGATIGGDEAFWWDDGTQLVADIEEAGIWGWNSTDTLTIELIAP